MSSSSVSMSKAADLSALAKNQSLPNTMVVRWSLPVLQAISEVEIQTVIKASVSKELLQRQKRVVGHYILPIRTNAILGGKLRPGFVVKAKFVFRTIEAVCGCQQTTHAYWIRVIQKPTLSIRDTCSPGLTVAACEELVTTQTKISSLRVTRPKVPFPAPSGR